MQRRIIEKNPGQAQLVLSCSHRIPCKTTTEQLNLGDSLHCMQCENLEFPDKVNHYLDSKSFDHASIPKGLLAAHSTKDRTWGKIIIESGELDYVVDDLGDRRFRLSPGIDGIISPKMSHHVEIIGAVQFHIEFYSEDK